MERGEAELKRLNLKIMDMINNEIKLAAVCRRFQFELIKSIGIFWLIEKCKLSIKEPWKTLYERSKKQNKNKLDY